MMFKNDTSKNRQRQVIQVHDTVWMHGSLATYPAVVVNIYSETNRVVINYWCDIRETWLRTAVDSWRLTYSPNDLGNQIGHCTCCDTAGWYSEQNDDGICPACQADIEAEAELDALEAWTDYLNELQYNGDPAYRYEMALLSADHMED